MKVKRIVITYIGNGDMFTEVAKEMMFNTVIKEMTDEGREVKYTMPNIIKPRSKTVKFNDGSALTLTPIHTGMLGFRATHIYADESIKTLPNGEGIINELLKPSLLNGDYGNYDTSGKQFSFFSYVNGELKIN